jgi:hypothetical protein
MGAGLVPISATIGGDRQVSCQKEVWMSAFGGKADIARTHRHVR